MATLVKILGWKCLEKQKKFYKEEEIRKLYEKIVTKYKEKKQYDDKKNKIITTFEILEEKETDTIMKNGSFGLMSKV